MSQVGSLGASYWWWDDGLFTVRIGAKTIAALVLRFCWGLIQGMGLFEFIQFLLKHTLERPTTLFSSSL